jgi:hypothetical protein
MEYHLDQLLLYNLHHFHLVEQLFDIVIENHHAKENQKYEYIVSHFEIYELHLY